MQFRPMSELIADARCNLIAAKLLLEPDDAEIQDRYRIYKGLGLVLGVAVFESCEPVVGEGVVETCSDRPTHARAVATDGLCKFGRYPSHGGPSLISKRSEPALTCS
jgi:hypothetical protein